MAELSEYEKTQNTIQNLLETPPLADKITACKKSSISCN